MFDSALAGAVQQHTARMQHHQPLGAPSSSSPSAPPVVPSIALQYTDAELTMAAAGATSPAAALARATHILQVSVAGLSLVP